ncbi:MAG: hypothetical protein IKB20_03465 [Clostridia bacterium]|nr:hypothetical protein [Clostridia bacterium]
MKIYFLSAIPCALTLNGVYFGLTDRFERFAEIHLADKIFAEFIPENAQPIRFFITERLPSVPPQGCEVYLLPDGLAVFARDFPPLPAPLTVIAQARFPQGLVTVFSQGGVQVSIENSFGLFTSYLPPSFSVCELTYHEGLFFLKGQNCLAVYTQKGRQVLLEEVLSFEIENGELKAVLPLSDCLGRNANCVWAIDEEGCIQKSCTLTQARTHGGDGNEADILKELLPYAFFESVLIGADFTPFLSNELQTKAGALTAFLGEFKAVVPTDDPFVCRLIYQKQERLFEARDFKVCVEKDKITDVTG